jgi:hypothetical protein
MTVTAVVCAYWPQRFENVQRIVDDLQKGTIVPDRILVLDNSKFGLEVRDADVVRVPWNSECRGKFVAALLAPADAYLLHDDDTSVGPRTLECLLRHLERGFVTGYWGVKLQEGSFMAGTIIGPGSYAEPVQVDAFHGRVMFMAHDALVRMMAVEEWARSGADLTGDDILAGLANPGSKMVPMSGDERFVDLSECGVAMQAAGASYFEGRDKFTRAALAAIAEHGIPTW